MQRTPDAPAAPDALRAVCPGGGKRTRAARSVHDWRMNQWIPITAVLASAATYTCAADPGSTRPIPSDRSAGTQRYGLDDTVRAARAEAARRTGLAHEAFDVVSAESVTWSDGGLGCPQPDRMYTQALVPGYRVRLRGPAGVLDYHASQWGALVLCPPGQAVDPVPGQSRI